MNNQVEPGFDRPLNPWSSECVIGNGNDLVFARDFRDRFQIDQLEQRITQRLNPNHARVRLDCLLEPAHIGKIALSEMEIRGAYPDPDEHTKGDTVGSV